MSAKKSFFDKLTGSMKITDMEDHQEEKLPIKRKDFIEQHEEKKPVEKRVVEEPIYEEEPERYVRTKKEPAQENFPPSVEGQLTIDVYQNPNEIVIKSTIAGVSPEDLDITITNDMVTIKGSRRKDDSIKEEDYFYQECYWGAFSRSVILPVDIEADKAQASIKNGILTLKLPKSEKIKTKKILVKEG